MDSMSFELDRLLETSLPADLENWKIQFTGFKDLFARFLQVKPTVSWNQIKPLPEETIKPYSDLTEPSMDKVRSMLSKMVIVKLNGGLGTTMGCKGPKSLIPVRHDLTFLDLTMQQIEHLNLTHDVDIPLVLMNSFNTDQDTKRALRKYRNVKVCVYSFNQSCYPRINKETLMPISSSLRNMDGESWYPPGHGDFYQAFYNSGLLDKFVQSGKEYCFVSNIDNLGATLDLIIENGTEFVMELTDKTRADVKGGTLIFYEGSLRLLELAQVPKDNRDEFYSVTKFKYFNTNNMWVNLKRMKELVISKKMEMEIIVNAKTLESGIEVLQLETAAGAGIKNFQGAVGFVVPRSRFLPVKKTQDLLLVKSNLYDLANGCLILSNKRTFSPVPLVKLGSSFEKVSDFTKRFPGIPDLLECDHLTVSGDVWFGKGIKLRGTVIIIANHGDRIDIPPGALLANKIVSGNLRIMDH
ncbi:UTP--glucose-1-phosphate uridylyltransferase [Trichinella nativa]|uniref:UTP--glucose-1-phosphate uridylyltransferase n=1 Tax=Trichinella nativa TaxID=6335 RepID=A0A1Y3EI97_9BILA|nr:UTP--glucose-1-phosphate uridylyltransferase [Trichinella nativa]